MKSILGPAGGPFELRLEQAGGWRGRLGLDEVLPCADDAAVARTLKELALKKVPLSVGEMIPSPSDQLGLILGREGWPPGFYFLQIAWRGTGEWVIREITETAEDPKGSQQWQEVPLPDLFK